jgi:hypothetical protein
MSTINIGGREFDGNKDIRDLTPEERSFAKVYFKKKMVDDFFRKSNDVPEIKEIHDAKLEEIRNDADLTEVEKQAILGDLR